MAASSGVTLGHGTTVRIGRINGGGGTPLVPVWAEIIGAEEVSFPDQTPEDVDTTWLGSPGATEESIPGLNRVGTLELPVQYVDGSPTDVLLYALANTRPSEDVLFEITPAGGGSHRWTAYVNSWRPTGITAKGKQMATLQLKVKAPEGVIPAAAPANTTPPAIAGVAQVGQILTAWPGVWTNGVLSYQWQVNDGGWTDIAGAAGQTYTPIVGQVGDALRVIVTATNGSGATSATSTPTANVIAA